MHIASALESIILQASYYSSPNRNIIVECWVDSPKTFDFQLTERRTSKANALKPKAEKLTCLIISVIFHSEKLHVERERKILQTETSE